MSKAPLYNKYPNQYLPQAAYLEIDFDRETVECDWDTEIGGGIPANVWDGRAWRTKVSPFLSQPQVDELVSEVEEAMTDLWDEYDDEYSPKLQAYLDKLEQKCEEINGEIVFYGDIIEYFDGAKNIIGEFGISIETSRGQLEEIAGKIEKELDNDVVIEQDIFDSLLNISYELNPEDD
jgi:hypothetical protein